MHRAGVHAPAAADAGRRLRQDGVCLRPLRLMPSHIVAAYEAGNMERLAELKVNLCMECGCCSFGCPAHRPLVQTNKLAKAKLAAWRKAQSEKLDAKKEAVK